MKVPKTGTGVNGRPRYYGGEAQASQDRFACVQALVPIVNRCGRGGDVKLKDVMPQMDVTTSDGLRRHQGGEHAASCRCGGGEVEKVKPRLRGGAFVFQGRMGELLCTGDLLPTSPGHDFVATSVPKPLTPSLSKLPFFYGCGFD